MLNFKNPNYVSTSGDVVSWKSTPTYAPSAPWGENEFNHATESLIIGLQGESSPRKVAHSLLVSDFKTEYIKTSASAEAIPTIDEICQLIKLKHQRNESHQAALKAEATNLGSIYKVAGLQQISQGVSDIGSAADSISAIAVMHLKLHFNRPRPYQLFPELIGNTPSVLGSFFPLHPSFPSGHSTQAHLLAYVLNDLTCGKFTEKLDNEAKRIAKNREIAGLHYSSDTLAGEVLAKYLYDKLKTRSDYAPIIKAAQKC